MSVFKRPLVALSLTEPDVELLRYAADVCDPSHCEGIRFAHVAPSEHRAADPARLDALRERMRMEVCEHFGSNRAPLAFDVVSGPRLDQILALSALHHNDVVLLGHRRGRSGHRSLARRLAMVSSASVWLVPEGSARKVRSILVPVDFSSHSGDALSFATALAASRGISSCTAVHVFFDPSSIRFEEHVAEVVGREQDAFAEFTAGVNCHGVAVELVLEESTQPPQAILRVAQRMESDLIVMNTRGRSRAAAILLGGITSRTMEDSTIPVLAFKHFGDRLTVLQALLHHRKWDSKSPKTS